MNTLAKKTLILVVSATLVACAAQREPDRDATAGGVVAAPPPTKLDMPTYSTPDAIQEQICRATACRSSVECSRRTPCR
jgi:hypothetical protein